MKVASGACFVLAGLSAWLFWGPVLQFGFSLIPPTAEYAWAGKIVVTVLVAWFGGVAVPIALFVFALVLAIKD